MKSSWRCRMFGHDWESYQFDPATSVAITAAAKDPTPGADYLFGIIIQRCTICGDTRRNTTRVYVA